MQKIVFEFRIHYKTNPGEDVYILGDIDNFGFWKEKKFKLEWTEGHIWKKEFEMYKNDKIIQYKYVVATNNNILWENRPNRTLDPNNVSDIKKENGKYILNQKWGLTTINFILNYHLESNDYFMMVKGNDPVLGEWDKNTNFENRKMNLDQDKKNKDYWKLKIDKELKNDKLKDFDFEYKYAYYDTYSKIENPEKGENRHVKILFTMTDISDEDKFLLFANPKEYKLEKIGRAHV